MTKEICSYLPVDWPAAAAQCMDFRRDAWRISYGSESGFSEAGTLAWYEKITVEKQYTFLHVWQEGQVIGQIEYRAPIVDENQEARGYINLLYLTPNYRGLGFGQHIHGTVLADMVSKRCQSTQLRVIKGNTAAQHFYAKLGWQPVGAVDDKGAQLLTLSLSNIANKILSIPAPELIA